MIVALQNRGKPLKLFTTLLSREETNQYIIQRKIDSLLDLPLSERIKQEQKLIDWDRCPNCGSSLNDIANHLEGTPLNYQCTYCKP